MAKQAPSRAHSKGISLVQVVRKFNTEEKAYKWFVSQRWRKGIRCPRCESDRVQAQTTHPTMPHRCRPCRRFFSVKTGTPMEASNIPLSKWAIALYLYSTNLKGVSSMRLHRDLDIAQKSAWHMAHRIREMYDIMHEPGFEGPVDVDETYIRGKGKWKHEHRKLNAGRGPVGKAAVVGIKERPTNQVSTKVVDSTDAPTLTGFMHEHTDPATLVFTDEARAYDNIKRPHLTVKHIVKEFVNGMVHTNGIESLWATVTREMVGVYHHWIFKHPLRYINEDTGRHNQRPLDTDEQMGEMVRNCVVKRLRYIDLIGPKHTPQPRML